MGCGESRERKHLDTDANAIEGFVFRKNCHLQLQDIRWEDFQSAVKRFGYRDDLTLGHLKLISKEIRLDFAELTANDNSIFSSFYYDRKFIFNPETQRFSVDRLMKVGFLHCEHTNIDQQGVEFWNLVNPKLDQIIPQEQVIDFIRDLIYIAVDSMAAYMKNIGIPLLEQGIRTVEEEQVIANGVDAKEEEVMKYRAVCYLKSAKSQSASVLKRLSELLPQNVTRTDLIPMARKQFFRCYQIRTLLTSNLSENELNGKEDIVDLEDANITFKDQTFLNADKTMMAAQNPNFTMGGSQVK